jgi:hypothetical protein
MRHEIAHLHLPGECEHIAALLVRDGDLVLDKSADDLLKRQAGHVNAPLTSVTPESGPGPG